MAKTILIVDDSAVIRTMLKTALAGAGFSVVEASSGLSALQKAQEIPVAAVISDLKMPEMDGLQFIRELKKIPNLSALPIFIYSSITQAFIAEQALKAGASQIFLKDKAAPEAIISALKDLFQKP